MKFKSEDIQILFSSEQIQTRIKSLASEINEYYDNEEIIVICVLKGAVVFAIDLMKHLNMPLKMEFIRLASYHGTTETTGKVKTVDISLPNLTNKNVLIIEDIIDKGYTARFLMDFINCNFKTKSTKFCSLLDKKIARIIDIESDFYGFEVEDQFVVGYGLDYDEYYRNLDYIGFISKDLLNS
ncbi:MAG: hypoxanthine phosphoribosyltransferase [Candidatus Gastranaerophilales bacterium]